MTKLFRFSLAVLLLAAFSPESRTQSTSTVLDYEGFTDSTVLSSQIPGVTYSNAIVLTSGVSLNEFEFPPHSGLNVVSDNGGPLSITFTTPVQFVSGYFTYSTSLTMVAYDGNGKKLSSATSMFSNNEAISGAMGSSPNELISVSSMSGITKVTITGLPGGGSFTMDDTTVMPPIVVTPVIVTPPGNPLTIVSSSTVPTIPIGGSFVFTLAAQGGTPPYSWSAPGPLPAGISFASNGLVSGKPPAAGNFRFIVTVTDSVNAMQSAYLNYSVLGITTTGLPDAMDFAPYSGSVSAIGGTLPYTFTASGLPNGITMNSQGAISGTTAQKPTTLKVAVQVSDATGVSTSTTLSINVDPPAALTAPSSTLAAGTVGLPYSQTLVAMNGGPPYSWALTGGTVPAGLLFDPAGVVSGTPTAAGVFTFSTKVSDIYGTSVSATFSLTVHPTALTISSVPVLTSGMVGVDYPVQVVTAGGGVPPYVFSLASGTAPPGLTVGADGSIGGNPTAAGSYSFAVGVKDAAGSTAQVSVSAAIRAAATSLILSTGSLSFNTVAGSSQLPAAQTVQTQSTVASSILSYSATITPAVPWLSLTQGGTATPTPFSVALTGQALSLAASATPYQATVVVACTAPQPCVGITQSVLVSLTVSSPPAQFTVSSNALSFTVSATSSQVSSLGLTLQNAGGGTVTINSVKSGAAWLTAGNSPGTLSAGQQAVVSITANPAGLNPGYYRSAISINGSSGLTVIPVTLYLAASPSLFLSSSGAQFRFAAGGAPPFFANTSFSVNIAGAFAQDLPTVNWTAAVLPGAPWLSTTTTAGTSTISTPGTASYSIDAGLAAGLAPGVYYGTVRISAMGVNDAPLDFEVVLNVAAAGGLAMPAVSPEGLVFVSKAGQSPAPQTVQLYSSNGATTSYQAGASSNSLVWLSVSPTAGTALSSLKVLATSTVSVTTAGLAPGVYYGGVSYAGASAAVRTINTTLIVIPSSGTCTPSQVVPARIGLVSGFSVSALSPAPLAVQLLNDCGGMVANGQLTATFSNGDAPLPLTLTNPGMGVYSTTWIPRQPSGGVTVTVSASAPGLASSSVSYAGSVLPNGSAPTLAPLSTLHVFNPATGAAVAPGTIVQIYGSNLAGQTLAATGVPLPGALGGTSVSIGGIVAPLFFVSPGQINAQAPFELAAEGQYQVVVNSGGLLSTPDTVHVSAVAPGVAALASGIAIAQHGDASLVSEQSPAKPGEALVLYAAGLGATDTPVASGAGSPSSPLAHPANAVSLTINGEVAAIQFGGLTPGLVGLYQVNFTVPTDAANGDLQLVLSEGGASANPVILPVHM